jgi:hypothetical protein
LDDLLPRVVKNRVSEKIDRHMITLLCCGRKFKCSLEDFKIIKRSKNFLFVEYGKEIEFISVTCQKCKKETLIREEDFKLKAFTKILKKL